MRQGTDFGNSTFIPQSIESQIEGRWFPEQPSNGLRQIDTQLGGRCSTDQIELPPTGRRGRELERTISESQLGCASREAALVCDGWCEYSNVPYANIVSIRRPLQEHSDLMLAGRSLCPPARSCSAPGKAQEAR